MLVFNQDLRFPMHLPLIGDRLGGALFYDAGNVFPSVREISLRTAPPVPDARTCNGAEWPANHGVPDQLHERAELFFAHRGI